MNTTSKLPVTVGLYRHFKGAYYYVTGISKDAITEQLMVNYFNICHPEYGSCVRQIHDFVATVEEDGRIIEQRPDNVTGQIARFERVYDLNFQLGSVTTEQLITELRNRTDSPIHELDIEELESNIFSRDYIVGEPYEATDSTPRGVFTIASFSTKEQAENYFSTHRLKRGDTIFKRTFIEVK